MGADRDEEAAPPRDHFSPVQVRFPVNAPPLRPPPAAEAAGNMDDFETENGADGAKASELGRQIKVEFSVTDIRFWFAEIEAEMTMASIKSQWLKRCVSVKNFPSLFLNRNIQLSRTRAMKVDCGFCLTTSFAYHHSLADSLFVLSFHIV